MIKLWRVLALLFVLTNMGGAGFAVAIGEGLHAAVHLSLLIPGVYLLWRLMPGARRLEQPTVGSTEGHLDALQQSLDAIALEVERIGEAQRFMVKLQQERSETQQ